MIEHYQMYVAVDMEADGPTPSLHSMLSLAAVATTPDKEVSRFYRKILPRDDAVPDPDTMEWWSRHPEAWHEVNVNPEPPERVMSDFCQWARQLGAELIFVAHPVSLDYTFASYYLYRYAKDNPFANETNAVRTLDLRSFIAGKYGLPLDKAHRTRLPAVLTKDMPEHSHKAIDDAVGYAALLRTVLKIDRL